MLVYTHDLFVTECKSLAEQVIGYKPTHILSIERGGGYVARELIKYLPRCSVVPIKLSFYDGQNKRPVPLFSYSAGVVFKKEDKVVICDDLVDKGDTCKFLKESYILKNVTDAKVAVLVWKPTSCITPDYYTRSGVIDWVKFHWEDSQGNHIL